MLALAGALMVRICPACVNVSGMKRWPMLKLCVVLLRPIITTRPIADVSAISIWNVPP